MRSWALAGPLLLALLLSACTTPDTSVAPKATPTASPTPTEQPRAPESVESEEADDVETVPVFAERGLFPVGVTTLDVGDRQAEVWYPANANIVAGRTAETFDTLSLFPPGLAGLVPEGVASTIETGAYRDIPAAPNGPYPVVVFSHGSPSYRQQSTNLTTHLASWGFVVISVDHLERGLEGFLQTVLDPDSSGVPATDREPGRDEFDVQNALNQLQAEHETPGSLLEGVIDLERLAASGQSAGASTALRLAELEAVGAAIAISTFEPVEITGEIEGITGAAAHRVLPGTYAVEITGIDEELTMTLDGQPLTVPIDDIALEPPEGGVLLLEVDAEELTTGRFEMVVRLGEKPTLVVSGADDVITPPERGVDVYTFSGFPKRLISIAGAGHDSFSDACSALRDQGGLDAALGDLADALGDLAIAGDNGCTPDSVDPKAAQAMAGHFMVAHLFDVFEIADVTGAFDASVADLIEGVELDDYRTATE